MRFPRWMSAGSLAVLLAVLGVSCSSTPVGPTIEISDTAWVASPASVEVGGGSFSINVINSASEEEGFAVVRLFNGDPATLPMVDGLLHLSRDGLFADAENPGVATFWVVYPDYERREGEGVPPGVLTPDTVAPGEETSVTIGGAKGGGEPGTYVVLSWRPGGYEAGDYASFTVTES